MTLFPRHDPNSVYLSMTDSDEFLSRTSPHNFTLEDLQWPTVEHYFQALQFEDSDFREKIRQAGTVAIAVKLGKGLFKKKRKDLAQIKDVIMTRAIYTKCRSHSDVADRLLATEGKQIIENSQFDYYWGCGRDLRGENRYGEVLMRVRAKLLQEHGIAKDGNRPT